jgi:hypothetical protein
MKKEIIYDGNPSIIGTITVVDEKTEHIKSISRKLENSYLIEQLPEIYIDNLKPRNRKERRHGRRD